uniref:MADS-box protein n=1 Tax=Oryza glumipatula TaxID=40148 RepID=A0A0E0BT19_9ORYZ
MGRGKVQVRRIENEVSRQVTFSKRRPGLLKKAHEIAVLCDVDVAAIVFSAKGNLFHYASSHTTMERILEKYDRHELLSEGNNVIEEFPELEGSMSYDHIKLRGKIEALKKSQRNLMGQELDSLTLQDIQQLENQIDTSLNNIRSRKNNLLLKSIAELRQKANAKNLLILKLEKLLMEKNTILEKLRRFRRAGNRDGATWLDQQQQWLAMVDAPVIIERQELEDVQMKWSLQPLHGC